MSLRSIRRLTMLAMWLLALPAVTTAQPATAPTTPTTPRANTYGYNRDRVLPSQRVLVWNAHGLAGPLALRDAAGNRAPLKVEPIIPQASQRDNKHHLWAIIDAAPGDYTLLSASETVCPLSVVAPPPPRPLVYVSPGPDAQSRIQAALDQGQDVELQPGTYQLRRLTLRPFCTLRGVSAAAVTIVADPDPRLDRYARVPLIPADFATVSDLTFRPGGDRDKRYVFHHYDPKNPQGGNMHVLRCAFEDCDLGEWASSGLVLEDCDFLRACANQMRSQTLTYHCTFRGLARHAWNTWGGSSVALVECDFINTDRGPTASSHRGDLRQLLYHGIAMDRINRVDNGQEGILFETARVYDSLFTHIRTTNSTGCAFQIWKSSFENNRVFDLYVRGGTGLWAFADKPEQSVAGNVFELLRFYDGAVVRLGQANRNQIMRSIIDHPDRVDTGNQIWYSTSLTGAKPCFSADKDTNNLARDCTINNPGKSIPSQNFILDNVRVH